VVGIVRCFRGVGRLIREAVGRGTLGEGASVFKANEPHYCREKGKKLGGIVGRKEEVWGTEGTFENGLNGKRLTHFGESGKESKSALSCPSLSRSAKKGGEEINLWSWGRVPAGKKKQEGRPDPVLLYRNKGRKSERRKSDAGRVLF